MANFLKRHENIKALLLYAFTIAVIYSPVVFFSKTLQPPLYQPGGITAGWPRGFEGRTPASRFNIDLATPAYFEWPVNKLIGDTYKKGELPLWNPYQAAGTPLAAQYSTRAFFPYQILEDIMPVRSWDYFILGRLLIAGFFTFLFLRLLPLSFSTSFLGGLLYMFSGSFTWFINLEQYANNAMMLPVLLYALERLFRARRAPAGISGAAIASGLVLLAGQPETALYVLALGAAYYVFRVISGSKGKITKKMGLAVIAGLLGLAIAAPLILPFTEFVKSSQNLHHAGGKMGGASPTKGARQIAILSPGTLEFPQTPEFTPSVPLGSAVRPDGGDKYYYRFFPINGDWDFLGGYTGIISLFLTLAGICSLFFRRKRDPLRGPLLFFAGFGGFMLFKNAGIVPFVWLGKLPLFDMVWSQRWAGPVWTFSFAVAGAIALELMSKTLSVKERVSGHDKKPSVLRAILSPSARGPLTAFLILLGVFFYLAPKELYILYFRFSYTPFFSALGPTLILGAFLTLFVLSACLVLVSNFKKGTDPLSAIIALAALELWWAVPRAYTTEWLFFKIAPFAIGLMLVVALYRQKKTLAVASAIAFFLVFSALDMESPKGMPRWSDPFATSPYVKFLKKLPGRARVIATEGILFPNFASTARLYDIRYINSLSVASFQAFRTEYLHVFRLLEDESSYLWFTGRPELFVDTGKGWVLKRQSLEKDLLARLPYYSLMGLRYIITPVGSDINKTALESGLLSTQATTPFRLIYDKEVRIFENPAALPRAFLVFDTARAASFTGAQAMAGRGRAMDRQAAIEKPPPAWFSPAADGVEGHGSARLGSYGTNSLTIEAESDQAGLLVLSDVYYPGWKAAIDGNPAEIYRVDGLIRGVFMPAGRHSITMRYRPAGFVAGAGLAASALLICVFLTTVSLRKKTPPANNNSATRAGERP